MGLQADWPDIYIPRQGKDIKNGPSPYQGHTGPFSSNFVLVLGVKF